MYYLYRDENDNWIGAKEKIDNENYDIIFHNNSWRTILNQLSTIYQKSYLEEHKDDIINIVIGKWKAPIASCRILSILKLGEKVKELDWKSRCHQLQKENKKLKREIRERDEDEALNCITRSTLYF